VERYVREFGVMIVMDGILYAVGSIAGGVLTAWLTGLPLTAVPFFVFAVFCLWFFRDPDRVVPPGPVVVSPADGKVMTVAPEGDALTRISIFLNVFDVHVNRSPVEGIIRDVQYRKGRFLVASKEAASVENEQTVITMETPDGVRVVFKQIAGLIARRVVFRKSAGERLSAGERIGMMKFGSRMDILLGREWRILVRPGERVIGGSTIIAERVQPTI
jgi:phosphatidylserine decarboxylase